MYVKENNLSFRHNKAKSTQILIQFTILLFTFISKMILLNSGVNDQHCIIT